MNFLSEEHTPQSPKYSDVTVQLCGEDGNIFSIMARVAKALSRANYEKIEIDEFTQMITECESYDEALQSVMRTVNTF